MKKLLAVVIVGGLLAILTTGCPAPTTKATTAPSTSTPAKTTAPIVDKTKTHEGKVVKVEGTKLTMKSGDKDPMTHDIGKDAKIWVDGEKAELKDLKAGQEIKVTMDGETVTKVEAKKAEEAKKPEIKTHEGKVVTAGDGKLTMTDKDDKEMKHDIGKDVKITVDGKAAELKDLKKGQEITVTMEDKTVTKIEAKKEK